MEKEDNIVFIERNEGGKGSADSKSEKELPPKDEKEKELLTKIEAEFSEAKEVFGDLIGMVSKRYESMPEKMREEFISHNEDILHNVTELGIRKGFSSEELRTLEVSAILHDIAKADAVPEEFKSVRLYTLVMHGEKAAEESEKILTDEYLSQRGFSGDFENIRKNISTAVREHMGPNPGFMSNALKCANEDLRKIGKNEIEHPQAQGKISETLLAADMASLASEKGRKKILTIRENGSDYVKEDLNMVTEYEKHHINLKQGEAALLSGFKSAFEAVDMIKNEQDKRWIEKIAERSLEGDYSFGGEKVTIWESFKKLRSFNESMRTEEKLGIMRSQLSAYKQ